MISFNTLFLIYESIKGLIDLIGVTKNCLEVKNFWKSYEADFIKLKSTLRILESTLKAKKEP